MELQGSLVEERMLDKWSRLTKCVMGAGCSFWLSLESWNHFPERRAWLLTFCAFTTRGQKSRRTVIREGLYPIEQTGRHMAEREVDYTPGIYTQNLEKL